MESSSSFTSKRLSSPTAAVTGKSCAICLRHVDTHRAAVITACMHAYCHGCLLRWTSYKRRCPLCNAEFTSYYSNLNQISSRSFRKHHLPPLSPPSTTFSSSVESRHSRRFLASQRDIRRTRREIMRGLRSRSRPLPRRRSFGWGENVTSDVIQSRILQWRASIYEQRLRATSLASRNFLPSNGVLDSTRKEKVIQRIEPWIRRETTCLSHCEDFWVDGPICFGTSLDVLQRAVLQWIHMTQLLNINPWIHLKEDIIQVKRQSHSILVWIIPR